jgi:hypothetical protein
MENVGHRFLNLGVLAMFLPMLVVILVSPPTASSSSLQVTEEPFATESGEQSVLVPSKLDCIVPRIGVLDILSTLNQVEYAPYDDRLGIVQVSSLTRGEPLSDEDADGIEWSLYQIAACANSLDPLTVLPLLSMDMQAALIDKAVNTSDLNGALDELPLLATDLLDDGGLPVATVLNAWYWPDTTKVIDAIVEIPLPVGADSANPELLVTFIWDKSHWIIDRVWVIQL